MISKKTISAIELCVFLAGQHHRGYVTTTEMSPHLNLSISYLENLLKPLKAYGLVTAMKGPGGGYTLAGDISLITMWDIAAVFESVAPTNTWASYEAELAQVVQDTLCHFTLADFANESADASASAFVQTLGRFKLKPMAAPLMPKAPNSVFQLSLMMA